MSGKAKRSEIKNGRHVRVWQSVAHFSKIRVFGAFVNNNPFCYKALCVPATSWDSLGQWDSKKWPRAPIGGLPAEKASYETLRNGPINAFS